MKLKRRNLPELAEKVAGGGICVFVGIMMLILTSTAFLFTTGMEIVKEGAGMDTTVNRIFELEESVVYYSDNFLWNLIVLAISLIGCRLLLSAASKLRFRYQAAILVVWTLAIGLIWVFSSQVKPSYDSAYVTDSARAFAEGDFSDMSGSYLREYPYQLGYIQLCEIIFRAAALFGGMTHKTLILQAANVVFLAAAYVGLLGIAAMLFPDTRVRHITFLLLLFCAQPILSCVFTYGIVAGICFAVWAILFQILWFKRDKYVYGILSALCIGFAVLVKSNNLIVLIAMMIVAALRFFKRKQYVRDIAVILAACIWALTFPTMVRMTYEHRSGVQLAPGVPYVSWFAMGLSESRRAPGWYSNAASNVTFQNLGSDPEAMSEYSKKLIKERIGYFKDHAQYTRDFFYRKYVSQFNETSYQSIWNNNVRKQYKEKNAFAKWVCGDGQTAVKRYMDVFAQLVFVGFLTAVFLMLRKRDYTALVLPLSVLGGMLFHLLAEGKSQYILPYFMLMLPVAAWGIVWICSRAGRFACARLSAYIGAGKGGKLLKKTLKRFNVKAEA